MPVALMYHDVVQSDAFEHSGFQSPDANLYKLEKAEFRRHLESLRTLRERAILTFDDGGASAVDIARMLEEFGVTGYFFVTTDYIGAPAFLNQSQIASLRKSGHVVGSHSCSHPIRMSRCSPGELEREWSESVRRLAGILDEPVTTASVPGGYYSRQVAAAAARAGIRKLFTSEPVTSVGRVDGCEVVGRFGVQRETSAAWVTGIVEGRTLPRVQRFLYWNLKKALKNLGGEAWLSAREAIFDRQARREAAAKAKTTAAGS